MILSDAAARKIGSAEGEALCRGSGPAHLGDATADSRKIPFSFLPPQAASQ